jgi:hypothetical protein
MASEFEEDVFPSEVADHAVYEKPLLLGTVVLLVDLDERREFNYCLATILALPKDPDTSTPTSAVTKPPTAAAVAGVGAVIKPGLQTTKLKSTATKLKPKIDALPEAPEGRFTVVVEDKSGTRQERKTLLFVTEDMMTTAFEALLTEQTLISGIHTCVSCLQPDWPGALTSLLCSLKLIGLSPDNDTPVVPIPPQGTSTAFYFYFYSYYYLSILTYWRLGVCSGSTRLACQLPDILTCILRFDQLIIDDPDLTGDGCDTKLKSITAGLLLLCTLQRTFPLIFHNVRESQVIATLSRIFCFVLARPDVAPLDLQV